MIIQLENGWDNLFFLSFLPLFNWVFSVSPSGCACNGMFPLHLPCIDTFLFLRSDGFSSPYIMFINVEALILSLQILSMYVLKCGLITKGLYQAVGKGALNPGGKLCCCWKLIVTIPSTSGEQDRTCLDGMTLWFPLTNHYDAQGAMFISDLYSKALAVDFVWPLCYLDMILYFPVVIFKQPSCFFIVFVTHVSSYCQSNTCWLKQI